MKKLMTFMLTLLMCIGMIMVFTPREVNAANDDTASGSITPIVEGADVNNPPASEVFHATNDMLQGTAYAVLVNQPNSSYNKDLIFFRSNNSYTNGRNYNDVVDIRGNKYSGVVYTGFERTSYTQKEDVPWFGQHNRIYNIRVADGQAIKPRDMSYWFYFAGKYFYGNKGFDTSEVVSFKKTFSGCMSMRYCDCSGFDTSNATDMGSMFYSGYDMEYINVDNFDTSKVTNMFGMFYSCRPMKSLNVSSFNTSNVTNMYSMFAGCTSLEELDLSSFNTENAKSIGSMFSGCSNLKSLDISTFNTSKVTGLGWMFQNCSSLTELDLSHFDTKKCNDYYAMFSGCKNLEYLDISNFNTKIAYRMPKMFADCTSLKKIVIGSDFTFLGKNIASVSNQAVLPDAPSNAPYTGKWIREDKLYGPMSAAELRDGYDGETMEGSWVWEFSDDLGVIQFDANGGYTSASQIIADSESQEITMPGDETTRPHYMLSGWNTSADGSGRSIGTNDTVNDIVSFGNIVTLYAQWEPSNIRDYKVLHYQQNVSLDDYSLVDTEVFQADKETTVTPAVKVYDGYQQPELKSGVVADDDSLVIEYYYDRNTYRIHFDGNGATSGQIKDLKMVVGIGSVLPENIFSKKGAIFTGWNTAQDGSGTSYTNGANVVDLTTEHGSTVTLYAQWLDNKDHATKPTDGAVRVTLKAGQTVVIPDLPAGTSYTIREVDNPQGWTFDHTDGETGTILANQTNSATVYNVYHAVGSIPLQINKVLVDGLTGESKPIEAGKFTFALIKSDGSQIQLASNEATDNEKVIYDDEGNEVNNPNYGKAIVTFDPIAYDESDIGKTYTYRIGEVNTPEGYTASDPINVTVSIADAGQGQLDITAQYDNNQTITNTDNSGGKLQIKKLVSGSAPEGAEFTFKVDLTDETGKTYTDTVNGKKSDESNVSITSGETVSLHADESVVFNLPAGIGYTVSEQTQDGWTLVQSSGETGTIVSEQTSTATFTNAYNVEGTVTLEADKVLTGKDLTANEFTFEVLDADGNVVATGTNDADGKVSLVIPYTADDVGNTYEYTVHEVKPEGDTFGVTYDETIYGVSVAVSAEGGKIVGNVSITDADKMTFTNTYNAETDITVSGKKVLEGREFRDSDKWTFNLSSEDGPLPEETSVEIAPINGDTFSFTIPFSVADMDGAQTKEFTYKVTESGSVLFVANDKSEKTFKVRVTDTKDGILKAELVDADNLDLTFTNKATVTLPATGSTTAIVLTIVGVVVIAGGLFFLLRKKKDDDEDE